MLDYDFLHYILYILQSAAVIAGTMVYSSQPCRHVIHKMNICLAVFMILLRQFKFKDTQHISESNTLICASLLVIDCSFVFVFVE